MELLFLSSTKANVFDLSILGSSGGICLNLQPGFGARRGFVLSSSLLIRVCLAWLLCTQTGHLSGLHFCTGSLFHIWLSSKRCPFLQLQTYVSLRLCEAEIRAETTVGTSSPSVVWSQRTKAKKVKLPVWRSMACTWPCCLHHCPVSRSLWCKRKPVQLRGTVTWQPPSGAYESGRDPLMNVSQFCYVFSVSAWGCGTALALWYSGSLGHSDSTGGPQSNAPAMLWGPCGAGTLTWKESGYLLPLRGLKINKIRSWQCLGLFQERK